MDRTTFPNGERRQGFSLLRWAFWGVRQHPVTEILSFLVPAVHFSESELEPVGIGAPPMEHHRVRRGTCLQRSAALLRAAGIVVWAGSVAKATAMRPSPRERIVTYRPRMLSTRWHPSHPSRPRSQGRRRAPCTLQGLFPCSGEAWRPRRSCNSASIGDQPLRGSSRQRPALKAWSSTCRCRPAAPRGPAAERGHASRRCLMPRPCRPSGRPGQRPSRLRGRPRSAVPTGSRVAGSGLRSRGRPCGKGAL